MPETTKDKARKRFFKAIKIHAPEVLESLETDVLPAYKDWLKIADWKYGLASMATLPEILSEYTRRNAAFGENQISFESKIVAWAQNNRLSDSWCIREALSTLKLWHEQPERQGDWSYSTPRRMRNLERSFRFEFPPYDSSIETIASYKKRIKAAFESRVKDYIATYKDSLEKEHDKDYRAYDIRKDIHFAWLVEHQIKGLRYEDIANKHSSIDNVELSSISEAITRLAGLIGLNLREAPGRTVSQP
jgi:hypothetical protein